MLPLFTAALAASPGRITAAASHPLTLTRTQLYVRPSACWQPGYFSAASAVQCPQKHRAPLAALRAELKPQQDDKLKEKERLSSEDSIQSQAGGANEGLDERLEEELKELQDEFDAGVEYGKSIISRFTSPKVDDPGLPYADALTVVSGSLFVAFVVLAFGLPRPGWLAPLPGVPEWRALPYVIPAILHGTQLATCWTLGALAATTYEASAFTGTLKETVARTWRAGAFATGLLVLGTQTATWISFSSEGLEPILGISDEIDYRLIRIADELIADVAVQATALTAFRIFRWWDATKFNGR